MSIFNKQPIKYVSKCCGAEVVTVPATFRGMPYEAVVCSVCREPCKAVLKGEEMKPHEGGIYCRICASKLAGRLPDNLELREQARLDISKGTCWGCGATIMVQDSSMIRRKE